MNNQNTDVIQGTMDMLILKTLSLGKNSANGADQAAGSVWVVGYPDRTAFLEITSG
jgi:hypothetical protein